jgi:hypothetical protein
MEPAKPISLLELLATLAPLDEEFPPIAELKHRRPAQPPEKTPANRVQTPFHRPGSRITFFQAADE